MTMIKNWNRKDQLDYEKANKLSLRFTSEMDALYKLYDSISDKIEESVEDIVVDQIADAMGYATDKYLTEYDKATARGKFQYLIDEPDTVIDLWWEYLLEWQSYGDGRADYSGHGWDKWTRCDGSGMATFHFCGNCDE